MHLRCADKLLDLSCPVVMGVINVTPDSFSDGGKFLAADAAYDHAMRMAEEGAGIIDIGGESTRPGAREVSVQEELDRVIPVVERLKSRTPVVVSVDTSKADVMRAAVAAGAGMVNDVRALAIPGALEAVRALDCAVCLMHMQGDPKTMQKNPAYGDVVGEVKAFLLDRVQACRSADIADERLTIDPGFGFGKTLEHNLELLRRLPELAACGLPLLVGMSRKSMIAGLLGKAVSERLYGSLALAVIAVMNGARIVRVHDVAATVDAVQVAWAARGV